MKRIGIFWSSEGEEGKISLQTKQSLEKAIRQIKDVKIFDIEVVQSGYILNDKNVSLEQLADLVDVAVVAVHGDVGESGRLQKRFEDNHIPYVGTNAYQSGVAFSKAATKRVLEDAGVQTAAYQIYARDDINEKTASEIFTTLPQPCIIKPSTSGSSYGVSKCGSIEEISIALREALSFSDVVIAEEFIEGREFAAGIITNYRDQDLYVLPAVEIITGDDKEFFDTESKYDGSTREVCPANIDRELANVLVEKTKEVCSVIRIDDYGRVDFIAHPTRGIFAIEVNTLPGMSDESLFPKAIEAIGLSMTELFEHMISKK